jgi:hypothetical protein
MLPVLTVYNPLTLRYFQQNTYWHTVCTDASKDYFVLTIV